MTAAVIENAARHRDDKSSTDIRYRVRPLEGGVQGGRLLLRGSPEQDWLALSGSARRLWELLDYPKSRGELVAALGAEYDAPAAVLEPAVDEALALFVKQGVIEPDSGPARDTVREAYLGLLKQAVANLLYPELEVAIDFLEEGGDGLRGVELQRAIRDVRLRRADAFDALIDAKQHGWAIRHAHTMIGLFRLANLERCAERLFADGIAGDFLEAGVCRGGAAIFLRGLQVAHGEAGRRLWVVDSFEGVPPPTAEPDRAYGINLEEARQPWIACDLASVREHFRRYGLLGPEVRFVPGLVEDTLPGAPIGDLALLRLDVDLYSATEQCLESLYDKLVPGGFLIVDDYGALQCCRDAVDGFRARRGIAEPIERIDNTGIYWRKRG
ncbi:MAG: O-methyltransferase [Sphingomonadales bacterium]|nr:O-methyltransferase [Sphingomonadales bacterium]